LPQQAERARGSRRIGLGITGLADALAMLGLRYGSAESLKRAADTMKLICHAAYRTSIALAHEKGSFPDYERDKFLTAPFIKSLPQDIQDGIATNGIRNSHLLAIAPTGTISLLAGNVSSGLEPVFAESYERQLLDEDGKPQPFELTDYALALWREMNKTASGRPHAFVTTAELKVTDHLEMQAALQPYVDNSISKTINVPEDYPFEDFKRIYDLAYDKGLKGCTTFRPNAVTGSVLSVIGAPGLGPHCCTPEREAD
jgi:ribonucleoside-diphosphate reductase alpha chain